MSAKPVLLRERARRDAQEAADHYALEGGASLGLDFVKALAAAFGHIVRHPASGSTRYAQDLDLPGLRCWPLQRFPYIVFYVEHGDRIEAWRILHGKRDLPAWMQEGGET